MARIEQGLTLEELRKSRQEIVRAANARGAHNVRVFGSVAKNEARATSDIDFLMDFEEGRTALDLSELILDLEEILGHSVDVIAIRRPSRLAEHIAREAIPL